MEMEKAQIPGITRTPPLQNIGGPPFPYHQAPRELQELAVEAFFYLKRNGYAVEKPLTDFVNEPNSREYRWTERGLRWISGANPVPEEAEDYMKFLREQLQHLDPVIEQYMVEALTAFERQAYFATAVMLGAASEKALYALAESLLGAIKATQDGEKLQDLLDRRRLFVLFEFVRDSLVTATKAKVLPYSVAEDSESHLMSIYAAVRCSEMTLYIR
jgi:hypothetical protein